MAFTDKQLELLNNPLDKKRVAKRDKSGISLSYLEGHDVMDFANKVFGFEKWNYVITKLEKVHEGVNAKGNVEISYIALVKTSVLTDTGDQIVREDVGYGNGVAKNAGDSYESATKEAITDALKRALRGFGNGFGLALYDKTQKNVKEFTAEDIVEQVKNIDSKAKVLGIQDYKDAIVETMIRLGVKEEDIPNCAGAIIQGGLDIKDNPRDVYENKKQELEDAIKVFEAF